MSTLTPPKPDTVTAAPSALRGPVRVLLRAHRKALWAGAALLVIGIGIVVALRAWMASAKELCADGDITPCGGPIYQPSYARTSSETFLAEGGTVLLLLAGLIGVFVAGPLIARELESGTFRLAWAQSVSPAHWLAARLAVPAALAVIGLTALIAVYRWGLWAFRGYPHSYLTRPYDSGIFPGTGPAVLGYALGRGRRRPVRGARTPHPGGRVAHRRRPRGGGPRPGHVAVPPVADRPADRPRCRGHRRQRLGCGHGHDHGIG